MGNGGNVVNKDTYHNVLAAIYQYRCGCGCGVYIEVKRH